MKRHLYVASGVMERGIDFDVLPGLILANSEDEARGGHMKWMQEKNPGWLVHSCVIHPVDETFIRAAVAELGE